MRTKNFPGRTMRRQASAKLRRGEPLTSAERQVLTQPKDIRIRLGADARAS